MQPIDWDNFNRNIGNSIDNAATETDNALAGKISSLTRLTAQEVQELFPQPADVKKLAELMTIVKSAEDRNTKITNLVSNAENFGGVMLTLLDKFV